MATRRYRRFLYQFPQHKYTAQVAAVRWGGKYGEYSDVATCYTGRQTAFTAPTLTAIGFPLMDLILCTWTGVGIAKGRVDLEEYRVYRATKNASAYCVALDAQIENGNPAVLYDKGVEVARVVCETRALFFVDVGYKESEPTKNPYGPREDTQYYYWVRAIGKDGLLGTLSAADNAILGAPDAITNLEFEEDETASFMWLKGWKVKWTPTGNQIAEAYFVKHRRVVLNQNGQETGVYGPWSFPHIVPYDTESATQSHTVPFLQVGMKYEFAVQSANHLIFPKYKSTWYSEKSQVLDAGAPDPPSLILVSPGQFHNEIAWAAPAQTDVAYYKVYRKATNATPVEADLMRIVPHSAWNSIHDFWSGKIDAKDWYYSIKSVDWFGNVSSPSTPKKEGSGAVAPDLQVEPFLWGNWIRWEWELNDKYYELYRSTSPTPVNTNDSSQRMLVWWHLHFFIDLGQRPGFRMVKGETYNYALKVVKNNLATTATAPKSGLPWSPTIDDIDGDVPWARIDVTPGQIVAAVNNSSLTLTPAGIEMKTGGTIKLRAGSDGVGTMISSGNGLITLAPTTHLTGILALGTWGKYWRSVFITIPNGSPSGPPGLYELYRGAGGAIIAADI